MKKNIETIARAVVIKKGKILICGAKGKSRYYFPGGHVEFGEAADDALARELKEELGAKIDNMEFIGFVENVFNQDKKDHHELNLVFKARIDGLPDASLEDHIEFHWIDIKSLDKENILPISLKKMVARWIKNKKIFWATENNLLTH